MIWLSIEAIIEIFDSEAFLVADLNHTRAYCAINSSNVHLRSPRGIKREKEICFVGEFLGVETYIIYLMCRIHQIGNINRRECRRGRFQRRNTRKEHGDFFWLKEEKNGSAAKTLKLIRSSNSSRARCCSSRLLRRHRLAFSIVGISNQCENFIQLGVFSFGAFGYLLTFLDFGFST